jgi:hypothetical protein
MCLVRFTVWLALGLLYSLKSLPATRHQILVLRAVTRPAAPLISMHHGVNRVCDGPSTHHPYVCTHHVSDTKASLTSTPDTPGGASAQRSPRSTLFIPSIGLSFRVISPLHAIPLIHECASFAFVLPRRVGIVAELQACQESFEIEVIVTSRL